MTTYDIMEATVTMPPTTKSKYYTVMLIDDLTFHNVGPCNIYSGDDVSSLDKPSASLGYFRPDWIKKTKRLLYYMTK